MFPQSLCTLYILSKQNGFIGKLKSSIIESHSQSNNLIYSSNDANTKLIDIPSHISILLGHIFSQHTFNFTKDNICYIATDQGKCLHFFIMLALELNQRLQKAHSQVTSEPLSKRELAFYSSERDISPNINNARYVQMKL